MVLKSNKTLLSTPRRFVDEADEASINLPTNAARKLVKDIDKEITNPNEKAWPGKAGPEDYYVGITEDPEQKQKVLDASVAVSKRYNAFDSLASVFSDEILILNDIFLDRIPATSISLSFPADVFVSESIRTPGPAVSTGGREDIILELSLVFPPGQAQSVKLRRLMGELNNYPFVYVYNNKIRNSLSIGDGENTIFVLETGNIRSISGQPGSIGLDLTLHYFNHKPFSNHFFYNAWLPGQGPTNTNKTESLPELGYDSGDYSESFSVKEAKAKAYELSKQLDDKRTKNAPVLMPSLSQPWLHYANTLEDTITAINENYSDYIGFRLNRLQYINPPTEEQAQGNTLRNLLKSNILDQILPLWKASDNISEFIARAVEVGQEQNVRRVEKADLASYTHLEDHELATYKMGNKILRITDEDGLVLARLLSNETNAKQPESIWIFWTLLNRYFHTGLSFSKLMSEYSLAKDDPSLYEKNQRMAGRKYVAIATWEELAVTGFQAEHFNSKTKTTVIDKRGPYRNLPKLVNELRRGLHPCPSQIANSEWVIQHWAAASFEKMQLFANESQEYVNNGGKHYVFSSDGSYGKSKKGELYVPASMKDRVIGSGGWKKNKGIPAIILPNGEKIESPKLEEQAIDVASQKTKKEQEIQRVKEAAKKKEVPIKEDTSVKKSKEARIDWIRRIEEERNLTYYLKDEKTKNIFYDTMELSVSGDKTDQDLGGALKNIVCSAVAVSFGHKLAPIGLLSQKHYTYQFMGAGNKAGQLVFTFAGPEGRQAADALKGLFSLAKDNALYFGQMIDEAGSVELVSEDHETNKQNAILALAGIKNVIISNVEEQSIPGSSDKYSLVVEFVAQTAKEDNQLQGRFSSTIEAKRLMVQGLMALVCRTNNTIHIDPKIARTNVSYARDKTERRYILGKNVPPWVAEAAIATVAACQKADKDSPPIELGTVLGKDWKGLYNLWGVNKIIVGNPNYDKSSLVEKDTLSIAKVNHELKAAFQTWSLEMEMIVRKVKSYMGDTENFQRYFPGAYEELVKSLIQGTSGCYQDLKLPVYPGTSLAMPPEFFVYDDSDEDPSVSGIANRAGLKELITQIVSREVDSHNHFALQSIAGGYYVSKNYWQVKQNRLGELGRKLYELENFQENNLFSDGALAWEPVMHRNGYDDPKFDNEQTRSWQKFVKDGIAKNATTKPSMFNGNEEETTFNYLESITKLVPHINQERLWATGKEGIAVDEDRYVKAYFGEDWSQIAFGPNLKNLYIDSVNAGTPIDSSTKAVVDAYTNPNELKNIARLSGEKTTVGEMTVMPDGSITIGQTREEKEVSKKETTFSEQVDIASRELGLDLKAIGTGLAVAGTALFVVGTGGLGAFAIVAGSGLAATTIAAIYNKPNIDPTYADELARATTREETKKATIFKLNDAYKKLMPSAYDKSRNSILTDNALASSLGGKSKDINFRRAFPTFKIYFIEDDSQDSYTENGKVIRAFDDFYSYSAIEEIRIVKSKDIPADLAIIRMANLSNDIFAKRFQADYEFKQGIESEQELQEKQGLFADTEGEDPFKKFVFQDGIKVQILLGYNDNPNLLTVNFLGQIVETGVSADGKLLEIVCQGYGAELDNVELGTSSDEVVYYSSQSALSAAIIQPTIINFGRQDLNAAYNPGEIREAATGGEGIGTYQGMAFWEAWAKGKLDKYLSKYTFLNFPQDDNIFAPPVSSYATFWEIFWNNACVYRPYKQTSWEIFKEHELRHPGYASLPIPYGHSSRMTMFFGSKSQHYWSKPPSQLEIILAEGSKAQALAARAFIVKNPDRADQVSNKLNELAKQAPAFATAMFRDILTNSSAVGAGVELGKMFGRYVPFRNVHYFDSSYHIISNTTKCSSDNVCNEVEVGYFKNENPPMKGNAPAELANGEANVYSIKLDDGISDDRIKTYHDEFPSCVTEYMAKRYAQGLFNRLLPEAYSGEITVIGDETIKPYDIFNLNDRTCLMSGTAEVREVIHVINRENGFISIITPGMCVSTNEGFDVPIMNTFNAVNQLMWGYDPYDSSKPPRDTSATLFPLFLFMATQDGAPVFVHPLTLSGQPFVPAAIRRHGNLFTSTLGKWAQWWDDLGNAFKKLDISEELYKGRVQLVENILRSIAE